MYYTHSWRGTALSDVGRVRSANQDAYGIDDDLKVWTIADGMGGTAGGSVASQLAVAAVRSYFQRHRDAGAGSLEIRTEQVQEAVLAGHRAIQADADVQPDLRGMGTTIVVACVLPGAPVQLILGHVGDSRAYLVRDQSLIPLTRDHSLVEEYVSRGLISAEEAQTHPRRNTITRALGIEGAATPDIAVHQLYASDIVLLCTDGLTKMLANTDILRVVLSAHPSAEQACQQLIAVANARGGQDNITALLITNADWR